MNPFPYKLVATGVGALLALAALTWLIGSRNHYKEAYAAEQSAHQTTIANYRAAATVATANDAKHKATVEAQQRAVNESTANEYEARIADVRARYQRLLPHAGSVASRPGSSPMPVVSDATASAPQAAEENGLSRDDALTASEQAIQLDELIKWVNAQTKVNTDEHPNQ